MKQSRTLKTAIQRKPSVESTQKKTPPTGLARSCVALATSQEKAPPHGESHRLKSRSGVICRVLKYDRRLSLHLASLPSVCRHPLSNRIMCSVIRVGPVALDPGKH